jgi:hypothetical protein
MADSWVPVMNTVSLSTQRSATSNAATSSKDATTTRDSVFSEVLLEALAKDWVLSVLNALPMPGADEGVTPAEDALSSPVATSEMESGTGRPGMSTLAVLQWLKAAQQAGSSTYTAIHTSHSADSSSGGNVQRVIDNAVKQAASKYGVPESIIRSVIAQESSMNPEAHSSAGAIGLMQLMPSTAEALGVNPWDPAQNIDGGTRYLAQLLSEFHGDMNLALAAYNAGPAAVRANRGIPPYPETQAYVKSVLARAASWDATV